METPKLSKEVLAQFVVLKNEMPELYHYFKESQKINSIFGRLSWNGYTPGPDGPWPPIGPWPWPFLENWKEGLNKIIEIDEFHNSRPLTFAQLDGISESVRGGF